MPNNNEPNDLHIDTNHNVVEVPVFLLVLLWGFLIGESICLFVVWKQREQAEYLIAENNKKIVVLEHRADSLENVSSGISLQKQAVHDTLRTLKHTRDSVLVGLRIIPADSLCHVFTRELDKAHVQ